MGVELVAADVASGIARDVGSATNGLQLAPGKIESAADLRADYHGGARRTHPGSSTLRELETERLFITGPPSC